MLVKNHEKLEDIGADLSQMSYILAGVCSVLTLSVLLGTIYYHVNFTFYP